MKALSIKQPWASLIAHGIKDIENRTWKTHFRGRIYIHASGKSAGALYELLNEKQIEAISNHWTAAPPFPDIPVSAIIGEVDIIDCVINHPSIWAEKSEYFGKVCSKNNCTQFIQWDMEGGRCESCKLVGQSYYVDEIPKDCLHKDKMPKPIYNWVLANPILYDKPILNVKGKLSFWEPDIDIIECVGCGMKFNSDETKQCDGEEYFCTECFEIIFQ